MRVQRLALLACALTAGTLSASTATAATIVYTISGTGSGTLTGTAFTNQPFSLVLTGNTESFSGVRQPLTSAVVNISGLSSATLTPATLIGGGGGTGSIVFFGTPQADLFDFFLSGPADLRTQFGPVIGTGVFNLSQFANVSTSAGPLTFIQSSNVQFSSAFTTSAVPEARTWIMMIAGFGMVGGTIRSVRRKHKVAVSYG